MRKEQEAARREKAEADKAEAAALKKLAEVEADAAAKKQLQEAVRREEPVFVVPHQGEERGNVAMSVIVMPPAPPSEGVRDK